MWNGELDKYSALQVFVHTLLDDGSREVNPVDVLYVLKCVGWYWIKDRMNYLWYVMQHTKPGITR